MSRFYNFSTCQPPSFAVFNLKNQQQMEKLISWTAIPSSDFMRAVNFYNKVFKLNLEAVTFHGESMACFPTGEGAIVFDKEYQPSRNGVIINIMVPDSIEEACKRIEAEGGSILVPKAYIGAEGLGYFAVFLDSEGNRIGLHEK